ncbi:hypothetical protein Dimus_028408 [Dionaea muscipula]
MFLITTKPPTGHRLHPPLLYAHPPPPPPPQRFHKWEFSRRDLAKSSLLLLLISNSHDQAIILSGANANANANAEEDQIQIGQIPKNDINDPSNYYPEVAIAKRAFLDVSIDGEAVGRIEIGLFGDDNGTPVGASRFSDLVSGRNGMMMSYRRKEFVKIMPTYVQHGGVRSGVVVLNNDALLEEWQQQQQQKKKKKNLQAPAGSVGIIVRDPSRSNKPNLKVVARNGKIEVIEEEEVEPSGTEFVIATKDSPELDESALVVGRVIHGMDVVHKIAQVKRVRENTTSPYFRVAKLIGDKRAVVAERGFNRPYSKIVVTNCGLLE